MIAAAFFASGALARAIARREPGHRPIAVDAHLVALGLTARGAAPIVTQKNHGDGTELVPSAAAAGGARTEREEGG